MFPFWPRPGAILHVSEPGCSGLESTRPRVGFSFYRYHKPEDTTKAWRYIEDDSRGPAGAEYDNLEAISLRGIRIKEE